MKFLNSKQTTSILVLGGGLILSLAFFQNCSRYPGSVSMSALSLGGQPPQGPQNPDDFFSDPAIKDGPHPTTPSPLPPKGTGTDCAATQTCAPAPKDMTDSDLEDDSEKEDCDEDEDIATMPPSGPRPSDSESTDSGDLDLNRRCEQLISAAKGKGFKAVELNEDHAHHSLFSKGRFFIYSRSPKKLELDSLHAKGRIILCGNMSVKSIRMKGRLQLIDVLASSIKTASRKLETFHVNDENKLEWVDSAKNKKRSPHGPKIKVFSVPKADMKIETVGGGTPSGEWEKHDNDED